MMSTTYRLDDMHGVMEYRLASNRGTATAQVSSGVRYADGSDIHPPGEPFKWALNDEGVSLKVTQAGLDAGNWWPQGGTPAGPGTMCVTIRDTPAVGSSPGRRARRAARRARLRVTSDGVTDLAIYIRDRWQCRMRVCYHTDGRAIDPALARTQTEWSPTIDHVVAVRDGGPNTAANKRAAHQQCNIRSAAEIDRARDRYRQGRLDLAVGDGQRDRDPAEEEFVRNDEVNQLPNCGYCLGERSPCDCTEDCGARPGGFYNCHVCPKAPPEVVAEWLRSTGLYSEEEIRRRTS